MKLDITCPVELVEWELLRDDSAHARAYLRIRNVCAAPIVALDGVVSWEDAAQGGCMESDFSASSLAFAPRETLRLPISAGYLPRSVRLRVRFTRVRTGDSVEWTGEADSLVDYPDPPRMPARMTNALVASAGEDAVRCAVEQEDGVWLCVCGRPNTAHSGACVRCGREKAATLRLYSPQAVEELARTAAGSFQKYYEPFNETTSAVADKPRFETASVPAPRRRTGDKTRQMLFCLAVAAVLCAMALGVRALRYAGTQAAGLMPTSQMPNIQTSVCITETDR